MTIFLDIAKYFLALELKNERKRAKKANEGMITGWLRDTAFSEYKIKKAKELETEILGLEDESSDEQTLVAIRRLIEGYKAAMALECKKKNLPEGEFGKALLGAIALSDGLYRVLTEKSLLDIGLTLDSNVDPNYHLMTSSRYSDPLDRFYYYAAFYFCQKAINKNGGLLTRFSDKLFWNSVEVADQKEKALLRCLEECKVALGELDIRKPRYPLAKTKRVLDFIDQTLRENANVCSSHATLKDGVSIGVSFPFSALSVKPTFKPTRGTLREYMEFAQADVLELKQLLEEQLRDVNDEEAKVENKSPVDQEDETLNGTESTPTYTQSDEEEESEKKKKTLSAHVSQSLLNTKKISKSTENSEIQENVLSMQ